MSRSYLGCRENISTGQMLFCSWRNVFRLPGKVSRCDADFVKCKQKVFPLKRESCVHMGWKLSRSPRSRLSASEIAVPGKTFRPIRTQCDFSYYFITRRDLACKLVEMFSR